MEQHTAFLEQIAPKPRQKVGAAVGLAVRPTVGLAVLTPVAAVARVGLAVGFAEGVAEVVGSGDISTR